MAQTRDSLINSKRSLIQTYLGNIAGWVQTTWIKRIGNERRHNFLFPCACRSYVILHSKWEISSVQSLSRVQLCDPMDCSAPGLPVHHQLPESTQTHVNWVNDAVQPSHPLSSPSPPAFNLFQLQGLFKWVSSLYQVAKVLEFQLQHQSFQWTFRTDL